MGILGYPTPSPVFGHSLWKTAVEIGVVRPVWASEYPTPSPVLGCAVENAGGISCTGGCVENDRARDLGLAEGS